MATHVRLSRLPLVPAEFLPIANAQNHYTLNSRTSFGGNGAGSVPPGDSIGLLTFDTGFNQRGIACYPLTTNLVIVDTHSGSGGSSVVTGNVYVVDGLFGTTATPSTLATNGISGGNYADVGAVIADDGVVYIANQVNV